MIPRQRCRCVGGAFWIFSLFMCAKVEVDRNVEHDKAVQKMCCPSAWPYFFPSIPQLRLFLSFIDFCCSVY